MGRQRLSRVAVACGVAGVVAACSSDASGPGRLGLSFDTERPGSTCSSNACSDYGMSCGATLWMRWADPDTGEVARSDDGRALEECRAVPSALDVCDLRLSDMPLTFFGVPQRNLRVEVAIFSPDDLAIDDCPPDVADTPLFDQRGVPRSSFQPQPAFAGASYVQADSADEVTVAMTCSDPAALDVDTCEVNAGVHLSAAITELDSVLPIGEATASELTVDVAEPLTVPSDEHGTETLIDSSTIVPLELVLDGSTPRFAAITTRELGDLLCTEVLDRAPQSTVAVSCQSVPAEGRNLPLTGLAVSNDVVDAALAALGESDFPARGLVIGRVVDSTLGPLADVTVTPEVGTVVYLDADLSPTTETRSTASGYFASLDIPFDTRVSARHSDGRREASPVFLGLVRGKVAAAIIRLEGEVIDP